MGQYCFSSLLSVIVCNAAGWRAGQARGRSGGRHCTAGQYGYVPLGRHIVYFAIVACVRILLARWLLALNSSVPLFLRTRLLCFNFDICLYLLLLFVSLQGVQQIFSVHGSLWWCATFTMAKLVVIFAGVVGINSWCVLFGCQPVSWLCARHCCRAGRHGCYQQDCSREPCSRNTAVRSHSWRSDSFT